MPLSFDEARTAIDFNPEGAVALLGSDVGHALAEGLHPVQAARLLPHFMQQRQERYQRQQLQLQLQPPQPQVDPQGRLQPPSVEFMTLERSRDLLLSASLRMEPPEGTPALTTEESSRLFACFTTRQVRQALGRVTGGPFSEEVQARLDEVFDRAYEAGRFQDCGGPVAAGARIFRGERVFTHVVHATVHGHLRALLPVLREAGAGSVHFMSPDVRGNTPMHVAASVGDAAAADVFLSADVTLPELMHANVQGDNPLHFAASAGHHRVVAALHARGVDALALTAQNQQGLAPVQAAGQSGHADVVRTFGRFLSPEQMMEPTAGGATVAHLAAERGHAPVFDALADLHIAPLQIAAADPAGQTPFDYAVHGPGGVMTVEQQAAGAQVIETMIRRGVPRHLVTAPDNAGFTTIHRAAQDGNIPALRAMIDRTLTEGQVMAAPNAARQTPVHSAVQGNRPEVIRFFGGEAGVSVLGLMAGDAAGYTPFHYAAMIGRDTMPEAFHAAGVGPAAMTQRNENGLAAVHEAGLAGQAPFVAALARHLSTDQMLERSEGGLSVTHLAAARGHAHVFDALADANIPLARIAAPDDAGRTPVYYAVQGPGGGVSTPEQQAAGARVIETLLRRGMDRAVVTAPDHTDFTPFHQAALDGNMPALRVMYDPSLAPEAVMAAGGMRGSTPVHRAAMRNRPEVVDFFHQVAHLPAEQLLAPDLNGDTPIHIAARSGHGGMVAAFQRAGALPDQLMRRNLAGQTPLDVARECNRQDVMRQALSDAHVPQWQLVGTPAATAGPPGSLAAGGAAL